MSASIRRLLTLMALSTIASLGANSTLAQDSFCEFHKVFREKIAFDENDFALLGQGRAVVRLLPVADKREVAVCGLVSLQVPAQLFLTSFRESLTSKTNPAIMEIGRFSDQPKPSDLETLTFEDSDLEDLKECVVGDCKVKLSAKMIESLHEGVDWNALDYRIQATNALKQILMEYVRDYVARGDGALIEYNDKSKPVRLAEEQRALEAGSTYIDTALPEFQQHSKASRRSDFSMVESALVWSKVKFGLKPVIAINHITIYKREQESGPQVLVTSKQIYANHYFDSSLALTAFVNIPGQNPQSYLVYENRSRADGLGGFFGRMKRRIVEGKAVDNLKNILESSKTNLDAYALARTEPSQSAKHDSWRGWRFLRVQVFLSLLFISALVTLLTLRAYCWKSNLSGETQQ
jgi:hypothetical protein